MRMVICLQIPTVFRIDGRITSVSYLMFMLLVVLGRQKWVQLSFLVPEPSSFEVEIAIEKLKSYRSQEIDQIQTELIQAVGNTLHTEIHECINSIWNKEELLQHWKESFFIPV
jgi:hypothetical protein